MAFEIVYSQNVVTDPDSLDVTITIPLTNPLTLFYIPYIADFGYQKYQEMPDDLSRVINLGY